jgi:hypothetical protein
MSILWTFAALLAATTAQEPHFVDPTPGPSDTATDGPKHNPCEAYRSAPAQAAATSQLRRDCVEERLFSTRLTSSSIAGDALQALGQVVLDKALESGWTLLRTRLRDLAGCDADAPTRKDLQAESAAFAKTLAGPSEAGAQAMQTAAKLQLKNVCAALETRIQDLAAEPRLLLDAALEDIVQLAFRRFAGSKPLATAALPSPRELYEAWRSNRMEGVTAIAASRFRKAVLDMAAETDFPSDGAAIEQTLWALARCAADGKAASFALSACSYDSIVELCPAPARDRLLRGWTIMVAHADIFDDSRRATERGRATIDLMFDLFALDLQFDALSTADQLHELIDGLLAADWVRSMHGAIELAAGACDGRADCKQRLEMFGSLMVGFGRYAASYDMKDQAAASTARKDAIKDLISRLTNRAERRSGVVFSLGGSLGLVGGVRTEASGEALRGVVVASPLHLGLGLGVDSYHGHSGAARDFGFHGELTAFDLGQYVVFENSSFDVKKPDVKAALSPGLKLGWRFALRQTPMFLAGFAAFTPFVRHVADTAALTDDGTMTFTLGGMLGVYIPFIDFN